MKIILLSTTLAIFIFSGCGSGVSQNKQDLTTTSTTKTEKKSIKSVKCTTNSKQGEQVCSKTETQKKIINKCGNKNGDIFLFGYDTNGDSILDKSEIDATKDFIICNGSGIANVKSNYLTVESIDTNNDGSLTLTFSDGSRFKTDSLKGEKGDSIGLCSVKTNSDGSLTLKFSNGKTYTTDSLKGEKGDSIKVNSIQTNQDGTLTLIFSDGTTYTTGSLKGEKGDTGATGATINSIDTNLDGSLTLTFSDGTTFTTGSLKGEKGDTIKVDSVETNTDGSLTLFFSDGTTFTTDSLKGEKGDTGVQGVKGDKGNSITVTSVVTNSDASLTLTFSDGSSFTTGLLKGDTGATGPQGQTGATGPQGQTGTDGTNGLTSLITSRDATILECPNGGVVFSMGVDTNQNNTLDIAEITNTSTLCIEDNNAPVAVAMATPNSAIAGTNIELNASTSTDSDGTIISYTWKEGSTILSNSETFTKNDFSVGTHTITLTVEDNDHATSSVDVIVTITAAQTCKKIVKTGQTQVYEAKDDGDYQKGETRSYTDHNLLSVIDNVSNLMWENSSHSRTTQMHWQEAVDYCENLVYDGFDDWRMPNYYELMFLTDKGTSLPAIDMIFQTNVSGEYWTSTPVEGHNGYVWSVEFEDGAQGYPQPNYNLYIRCVREN